jgi:3-methyladenine DNA glycosylase/8-oxoguanine DNA glycosylase
MARHTLTVPVLGPWSLASSKAFWAGFTPTAADVKGLGPFAAELLVIRGANAPDVLPTRERRLEAEVAERYGPDRSIAEVSEVCRPFRTWAAVHLRTLREERTRETGGSL